MENKKSHSKAATFEMAENGKVRGSHFILLYPFPIIPLLTLKIIKRMGI